MKKALATTLFAVCSVVTVAGYANEADFDVDFQPPTEIAEGNVIVNSRPLSSENRELMESQRRAEMQESGELIEDGSVELAQTSIPIKWKNEDHSVDLAITIVPIKYKDLVALTADEFHATAANYSPYIYHWIDSFPQGNIIKVEDGSEWIFNKDQAHIVRDWRSGDAVVVMPKGGSLWGTNYAYTVTNKDLGTSVDVNIFLGPIAFGAYSTWLIGIDMNLGQIYLLNGQGERTVWEVAFEDLFLIREHWATNDTLFIGENGSWLWWFSSYNSIIVNVNMNHYVRVRQVSSLPNYRNAIGLRG